MQCPYCLSEVHSDASVCKTCTRDLYLFKPMMAKVADLETRLSEIPDHLAFEDRIRELEQLLDQQSAQSEKRSVPWLLLDIAGFIVLPLILLLVAHAAITIVYDTNIIYLRLISIILPLPFGYFLFSSRKRSVLAWFMGVAILALTSVIGMSWITSLVDRTPILPQNAFEWREVVEYAASISFSFLTGMLFGGITFTKKIQRRRAKVAPAILDSIVKGFAEGKLSPQSIEIIMKKLHNFGSTAVALVTTAISIYTGFKGVLGD